MYTTAEIVVLLRARLPGINVTRRVVLHLVARGRVGRPQKIGCYFAWTASHFDELVEYLSGRVSRRAARDR